jgi:excisionase family DNA binding protein
MVEPDHGAEFEERFFPVALVAEKLAISEKSVRRKIATGELPVLRVGKLLRIGERDLAAYLAQGRLGKRPDR